MTHFLTHSHSLSPSQRKKGAIILATGGDNSNSAKGNFYEGFMATGVASEATDEAIQVCSAVQLP